MAESLGWYDTDETTPLAGDDLLLGAIPPGQSYFDRNSAYRQAVVKNDGTEDFAAVQVEIQQAAFYAGHTHLRIAADDGGSPGTWLDYEDAPLALGALAVDATAIVWIDVVVPGAADADEGHASSLVVTGNL